jgi:hypothetical protein
MLKLLMSNDMPFDNGLHCEKTAELFVFDEHDLDNQG